MPLHPEFFTAGGDPFDYGNHPDQATHSMKSDGGFHVLLNYNDTIDGGKPKEEWKTYTTVCSYRFNPPSIYEYCEDVLMACVWYGAMLVVERNKTNLWKHFIDRGYGGYLVYMVDEHGQKQRKPGVYTGQGFGDKDTLFNFMRDYISDHIFRERHVDIINEALAIQAPDKLRHFDLLTAIMLSLVGEKHGFQRSLKRINTHTKINLEDLGISRKTY